MSEGTPSIRDARRWRRAGRRRVGADSGARPPSPVRGDILIGSAAALGPRSLRCTAPSRSMIHRAGGSGEGIIDATIDSRCDVEVEVARGGPRRHRLALAAYTHRRRDGAHRRTSPRSSRRGAHNSDGAGARLAASTPRSAHSARKSSFVRASPAQRGRSLSHSPVRWTDWTPRSGSWRLTRTGPIRNRRCATPRQRPCRPADAHVIAPPRG